MHSETRNPCVPWLRNCDRQKVRELGGFDPKILPAWNCETIEDAEGYGPLHWPNLNSCNGALAMLPTELILVVLM